MTMSASSSPSFGPLIEDAIRQCVPKSWDENHITFTWLHALYSIYGNRELPWGRGKLLFDCQKLRGDLERKHGDIGMVVKVTGAGGNSFVGFASLEAKRSYPEYPNDKYHQLDIGQLQLQTQHAPLHRLLLYSHTALGIAAGQSTHACVLPAHLGILRAGDSSSLEGAGISLTNQIRRYFLGWDLDFSPAIVSSVLDGEHRYSHLLRAHVGLTGDIKLGLQGVEVERVNYVPLDAPDEDMSLESILPPAPRPSPRTPSTGGRRL